MPLHVYIRHCNFSKASEHKPRPAEFSRENCYRSAVQTLKSGSGPIVLFDGEPYKDHFLLSLPPEIPVDVRTINGGSESRSFEEVIKYITSQNHHPEDIILITEDDYLFSRPKDWSTEEILSDALHTLGARYVTLYDHPDKYMLPMYRSLLSSLYLTQTGHWRTTPSTTSTFAVKFKHLVEDRQVHLNYCDHEKGFVQDHQKFLTLWSLHKHLGPVLVSSIPGYWSHQEVPFNSKLPT